MTMPSLAVHERTAIRAGRVEACAAAGVRDASLDYLRASIVVLVLVHHSVLAYAMMWPVQPRTFHILPAPIIDPQRFAGFDLLAIFNDSFFMALMLASCSRGCSSARALSARAARHSCANGPCGSACRSWWRQDY